MVKQEYHERELLLLCRSKSFQFERCLSFRGLLQLPTGLSKRRVEGPQFEAEGPREKPIIAQKGTVCSKAAE